MPFWIFTGDEVESIRSKDIACQYILSAASIVRELVSPPPRQGSCPLPSQTFVCISKRGAQKLRKVRKIVRRHRVTTQRGREEKKTKKTKIQDQELGARNTPRRDIEFPVYMWHWMYMYTQYSHASMMCKCISGRPPRDHRIPRAAQTKAYTLYTKLFLLLSLSLSFLLSLLLIPSLRAPPIPLPPCSAFFSYSSLAFSPLLPLTILPIVSCEVRAHLSLFLSLFLSFPPRTDREKFTYFSLSLSPSRSLPPSRTTANVARHTWHNLTGIIKFHEHRETLWDWRAPLLYADHNADPLKPSSRYGLRADSRVN